jgi:hypothetical protein
MDTWERPAIAGTPSPRTLAIARSVATNSTPESTVEMDSTLMYVCVPLIDISARWLRPGDEYDSRWITVRT